MANSRIPYARLPSDDDAHLSDPPPYTPNVSSSPLTSDAAAPTDSPSRANVRADRLQRLPPAAPPPPYSAMAPAPQTTTAPPLEPQFEPVINHGPTPTGEMSSRAPSADPSNAGLIAQTMDPHREPLIGGVRGGDTELTLLAERRAPEIVHGSSEPFQVPDTSSLFCLSAFALLLCWPFGALAMLLTLVARSKFSRRDAPDTVRLEALKLYMLAYRMAICGIMFGCVNLLLLFALDPARIERERREQLQFANGQ